MRCSVKIELRELKIVKDSQVVKKGSRKNEVFILDKDVVNGEAEVSSINGIEKTKLWYLRL